MQQIGWAPSHGWLACVAVVFIKQRASDITAGWDDKIDDTPLNTMIKEILTDNDTAFQSSLLKTFLDEWRVRLRFRYAYVPSGNGIIEQCYRTVKRIAARKQCTIPEAVYWYNVTPKDDVSSDTAPANIGTTYSWKESMEHWRWHILNNRQFSNRVTECG